MSSTNHEYQLFAYSRELESFKNCPNDWVRRIRQTVEHIQTVLSFLNDIGGMEN